MVTSYHLGDVPGCPDCGDRGRRLKGDYFWCPSCHAQWEEKDWDNRMVKEKATMAESRKMEGVISCLVIDELRCDNCGEIMRHAHKYCANYSEMIESIEYSHKVTHPKRYCKMCSIKVGYLKRVKNTVTGDETVALFIGRDEIEI